MGELVSIGDKCTCAEVEGEDPQCALHGLSLSAVAAWTDDDCMIEPEMDSFTVRRLVRRAVAALKPFANAGRDWCDEPDQRDDLGIWEHPVAMQVTIGDLRRAAVAMEARSGEPT